MRKATAPIVAVIVVGAGLATFFALRTSPEPVTSTYFLMDTILTIKTTGAMQPQSTSISMLWHPMSTA